MAYCINCEKELEDQEKFCPECGKQNDVKIEDNPIANVLTCFKKFAKIGYILGLITFIIAFLPFVSVFSSQIGPAGIVFSVLGKKDKSLTKVCKKGFILSLLGTIIGTILYFVYLLILNYFGIID